MPKDFLGSAEYTLAILFERNKSPRKPDLVYMTKRLKLGYIANISINRYKSRFTIKVNITRLSAALNRHGVIAFDIRLSL